MCERAATPRVRPPLRGARSALLALALLVTGAALVWAATVTIGFDTFAGGTLVTTQLQASQGVSFPRGVVATASARARSAPNVAFPRFDGEFARDPFEAQFTANQNQVKVWFDYESDGKYTATLRAYGPPPS